MVVYTANREKRVHNSTRFFMPLAQWVYNYKEMNP